MARLTLSLLGALDVSLDGKSLPKFPYDKVLALLTYLILESHAPHRRSKLAWLLWPEHPESSARHSLRQALFTLRMVLGDRNASLPFILSTRVTLQANPGSDFKSDVAIFLDLLRRCEQHLHQRRDRCPGCIERLGKAMALYRGDLFASFALPDSDPFEEWAAQKRAHLQDHAMTALADLAAYCEQQQAYDEAARYARRQLELAPWAENAHRQLMRALALAGDRAAALNQYQQCRARLLDELGIEPHEATVTLYQQIRDGLLEVPAPSAGAAQLGPRS